MAREVNLSSREWCDLVFEGKNKDFGAYVIRTESPKRHNKAVLWTLIGAILFGLLVFGFEKANQYFEDRRIDGMLEQQEVLIDMSQETEEQEPENECVEPEKPEVQQEESLITVRATELQIVEDQEVHQEDEIVTLDERMQSNAVAGQVTNLVGTTDLNVGKLPTNVVVVEPKPVD